MIEAGRFDYDVCAPLALEAGRFDYDVCAPLAL